MKKGQKKTMSAKQIEANRNNGHKSKGPTTPNGKARSSQNAITHGILSKQVVVRGFCIRERGRDFKTMRERFWEHLAPVGPVEEMLVDVFVTSHWRLRRVLTAERGEIAHSVDNGWWRRLYPAIPAGLMTWSGLTDPVTELQKSSAGASVLMGILSRASQDVEKAGELTEEALQRVTKEFRDIPNVITRKLKGFRAMLSENPDGLQPNALKVKHWQVVEEYLGKEFQACVELCLDCRQRETKQEDALQAAAVLPSAATLDKILRYETTLKRQMDRAMHQLERLQRMRKGEEVPVPLTMDVTARN
jgi:hypothetical protein